MSTKQGVFKYTVIAFGVKNISALFYKMIDVIFKDMAGCIRYLDNIFIYVSNTKAKYQATVGKVLQLYV